MAGRAKEAEKSIDEFKHIFAPGISILRSPITHFPSSTPSRRNCSKYGKQFGLKIVATNDVHYVRRKTPPRTRASLHPDRGEDQRRKSDALSRAPNVYLKSTEEMAALFKDVPGALASTLEIAEKCDLKIVLGENKFPAYTVPEGETREGYLQRLCYEGLKKRFPDRHGDPELRKRLDFDTRASSTRPGFTSYFLIVWDFIHYAKT